MEKGDKVQFKSNGGCGIDLWENIDGWKTADIAKKFDIPVDKIRIKE